MQKPLVRKILLKNMYTNEFKNVVQNWGQRFVILLLFRINNARKQLSKEIQNLQNTEKVRKTKMIAEMI